MVWLLALPLLLIEIILVHVVLPFVEMCGLSPYFGLSPHESRNAMTLMVG